VRQQNFGAREQTEPVMVFRMEASRLLAQAFHEDPFLSWAEPNPERRSRTLERLFVGTIQYAKRTGGVIEESGLASVDWRDGKFAHTGILDIFRSGLWKVALVAPVDVWRRLAQHEDAAMARVQRFIDSDTTYLCSLGVAPDRKGQGHGSRILQKALNVQSRRWRTTVLRTEQPRNVEFYLKNGLQLVDEFVVRESGLRSWVFKVNLDERKRTNVE
jgi:GNAT superfamily N-acetyltransferase